MIRAGKPVDVGIIAARTSGLVGSLGLRLIVGFPSRHTACDCNLLVAVAAMPILGLSESRILVIGCLSFFGQAACSVTSTSEPRGSFWQECSSNYSLLLTLA